MEDTAARKEHWNVTGQLEEMVRRSNVTEYELQRFLELHAWLLLGDEYTDLRPQVVLQRSGRGTLRPDFFLKPVVGESWDILDLKLPQVKPLIAGRADRRTYSQKVASGIAQLSRYGRYFDDAVNRQWVEGKHGIFAYRPRLMLLIGTSFETQTREDQIDIRRSAEVDVITYEELLQRVKHRMQSDK